MSDRAPADAPIFMGSDTLLRVRDAGRQLEHLLDVKVQTYPNDFVTVELKFAVTGSEFQRIAAAMARPDKP